jgi:hypothetical protein
MVTRQFGNVKQLIHAIIAAIASHKKLKNPGIYYPNTTDEVLITRYRAYGGYDLDSPGLTLSVYPIYPSRLSKGSALSKGNYKSVEYVPTYLGSSQEFGVDTATYTFIIDLTYLEGTFGETSKVKYQLAERFFDPLNSTMDSVHGTDINVQELSFSTYQEQQDTPRDGYQVNNYEIEFDILPAEEILREYVDLLRLILNELPTIRPYLIRSSQVTNVNFPTSAWSRDSTDLLLHSAYLIWEVTSYAPRTLRDIFMMQSS